MYVYEILDEGSLKQDMDRLVWWKYEDDTERKREDFLVFIYTLTAESHQHDLNHEHFS